MNERGVAPPQRSVRLALVSLADITLVLILAGAGWWLLQLGDNAKAVDTFLKGRRSSVYGAVISVHAGLLGFVLATTTIVLGYAQSERFEMLRQSAHHRSLYRAFTTSIGAFAVATVATLVALLVDRDDATNRLALTLAAAASLIAIVRLGRTLHVLRLVIDVVITSRSRDAGR